MLALQWLPLRIKVELEVMEVMVWFDTPEIARTGASPSDTV